MATGSITKKPCCKCNKGGATFTCNGCRQSFCLKHTSDHRQELSQQMDNIGQQHDVLKRDIDEQSINKKLLAQIDRWEKESIEKIRSSADAARTDLKQLTEESKSQLSGLMSKLSNELHSNRESDDYTEDDLNRWVNQLKELREELEKPSEIKIVEDKPSYFCLIKPKKRNEVENNAIDLLSQNVACSAEKFSEVMGPIVLSKDGCSAICTSNFNVSGNRNPCSSACGLLQYSCGNHNLRFRINTSRDSIVFFGILNSSQPIVDDSSALYSAYGYRSNGRPIVAGSCSRIFRKMETQPNDEVLLILDCSSRKISYIHERTQLRHEMEVEKEVCPLPWKLVVTLWHPKDNIEILNF
jgi:hypothetical protein